MSSYEALLPWVLLLLGLVGLIAAVALMIVEFIRVRHELRRLREENRCRPCNDLENHIYGARGLIGTHPDGTMQAGRHGGHMTWGN
jgi:beta-lactamase regulating signal transducer with metallopeptidase domain